jgi:hypothetical protein
MPIDQAVLDEAIAAFHGAKNAKKEADDALCLARKRIDLAYQEVQQARIRWCEAIKGSGQEAAFLVPWEHIAWSDSKKQWQPMGGSHCMQAIEEFVLLAGVLGTSVSFEFNGTVLSVDSGSNPSRIEVIYWEKRGVSW